MILYLIKKPRHIYFLFGFSYGTLGQLIFLGFFLFVMYVNDPFIDLLQMR